MFCPKLWPATYVSASRPGISAADVPIPPKSFHSDHILIAALMKIHALTLILSPSLSRSCRLLLNIPLPACQTKHMVCKAVFRFFLMQVSMSCPPMTDLVPCVLWKAAAEDVILPREKEKEFFVFKQIKVIIPLSVTLTRFLSFTSASFDSVFIFLVK